jgi:hypothetical protein
MEEWQKWEESIEVKIPSGFQLRRVSRPWAREFSTHIPEILRFWTFGKRLNAVIGEPSLRNVSSRQEAGSVPITKASQAVWTVWSVTSSTPTCKICKICKMMWLQWHSPESSWKRVLRRKPSWEAAVVAVINKCWWTRATKHRPKSCKMAGHSTFWWLIFYL